MADFVEKTSRKSANEIDPGCCLQTIRRAGTRLDEVVQLHVLTKSGGKPAFPTLSRLQLDPGTRLKGSQATFSESDGSLEVRKAGLPSLLITKTLHAPAAAVR